jgi:hypothetical protein
MVGMLLGPKSKSQKSKQYAHRGESDGGQEGDGINEPSTRRRSTVSRLCVYGAITTDVNAAGGRVAERESFILIGLQIEISRGEFLAFTNGFQLDKLRVNENP